MAKTTLKKESVKKINLAQEPVGYVLEGRFKGFVTSEPFKILNEKTGEITEKSLKSIIMEDDKGERFAAIADKGLQSAIQDSMVTEGTWIKAVKLEKASIGRGRTMNQYDLYAEAK